VEEDEGVESNLWVVLDEPETTGGGGAAVEQGRRRWRTPARMLRRGRSGEAGRGSFTEVWGILLCAWIGEETAVGRGSVEQGWGRRYGWRRRSVPCAHLGFVCTGKGEVSEASAGLQLGGRGTL